MKRTIINFSMAAAVLASSRIFAEQAWAETASMKTRVVKSASASAGVILKGILDLPRLPETGPIDGCGMIQKGLTNGGGFMVFTCEKLLPYYPIDQHNIAAGRYHDSLISAGWNIKGNRSKTENTTEFVNLDRYGCERSVKMMVWTDRAMNETPMPNARREAFRQIVFLTQFKGAACEPYYETVKSLAGVQGGR